MRVITAHRILIGTSIVFFFFFAAWELRNYFALGNAWAVARSALYFFVAIGFAIYLKSLKRWYS